MQVNIANERDKGELKQPMSLIASALTLGQLVWIERGNYYILLIANVTKNKFFSIDTNSLTLITFSLTLIIF